MELFYARAGGFENPLCPGTTVSAQEAESLGLLAGMPFVLNGDGSPDDTLNQFFLSLPATGGRSANTWRAYAGDLLAFARFLAPRRRSVLDANWEDLQAYYALRRMHRGELHLSKGSWNRAVAALERFYEWAVEERLIAKTPFRYRARRSWNGESQRAEERVGNVLRAKGAKGEDISYISMEAFRFFREVGLRGLLPDGRPDPNFGRRNGQRDALMANLLVTTGMRIEEGSTLLLDELPTDEEVARSGDDALRHRLAPPCAKGDKSRYIYVPRRALEEMHEYVAIERSTHVAAAAARGTYDALPTAIIVHPSPSKGGFRFGASATRAYGVLDPRTRRRLLVEREGGREPAWLFLSERGQPVSTKSWDKIFRRACDRCRSFGRNLSISPHDLRHTYAIHLLSKLIHRSAERAARQMSDNPGKKVYDALMGDALNELRIRMGHADITTTYKYLRALKEVAAIADAATRDLEAEVFSALSHTGQVVP